jgi:acyl carrier protein
MTTMPSVLRVLARRLGRPACTIHLQQDLVRDLDVSPVDLVLVALDIENAEDVDIDVERLEDVRTVAELSSFFAKEVARARARRARACPDVAGRGRPSSVRPSATGQHGTGGAVRAHARP